LVAGVLPLLTSSTITWLEPGVVGEVDDTHAALADHAVDHEAVGGAEPDRLRRTRRRWRGLADQG